MLVSSVIAISIACGNVSTRMWYRMGADGRSRTGPGVHPDRKTRQRDPRPVGARVTTAIVLTSIAYLFTPVPRRGQSSVPIRLPEPVLHGMATFGYVVLIIYTMGNLAPGCSIAASGAEFNIGSCRLFPVLSTLGMLLVLLFSLNIIGGGDPLTLQLGQVDLATGTLQHRGPPSWASGSSRAGSWSRCT